MEQWSEPQFFKFRDSRQERIYKRLKLVGDGPPNYFRDACRLRDTEPSFETTTHLIGHLIREIESSLRAVLLVFAESTDKPNKEGHIWEIRQIIDGLDIPEENSIAGLWLKNAPTLAHGRAHRDNLLPPTPLDENFLLYLDEMESIFDFVLTRFEEKYLTIHEELDKKLLIENPSETDAKWLKKNVPNNPAALGYFFNRLENPNWLKPLQSEGLFNRPPEPIYEPEKESTVFPPWSLSSFLIRMAELESEDVKSTVGEILLGIESTNFIIHLNIVDAACFLPIDLACRIAEKENEWLKRQRFIEHLIPDKFAKLTVYLANGNKPDFALAIASIALSFVRNEEEVSADESYFTPDPPTRMKRWDYGQFVHECWASLAHSDWQGSLKLFCDLLNEYLRRKYPERTENAQSYSYIWHRAIEHSEDGIPNLLLSTIRRIAEQTVSADGSTLAKIIEILESYRWDVYKRIVLHLLRLYPADAEEEIKNRLLSEANFHNTDFFHEYVLLLTARFEELEDAERRKILGWIDESVPTVKELKKGRLEWNGAELSDEDAEKLICKLKLKWLEPLKDVLPDDWIKKYEVWTGELGHPDHPGYLTSVPQTTWGQPEPLASEVLSKLESVEDVIDYLSKTESERIETPQELSRELLQLVKNDLDRFVSKAEQFEGLSPIYVRSFLSGVQSSVQQIPEGSWSNLLNLINWVMEQPTTEVNLSENSFDAQDNDWLQTRILISDFVSSVFSKEAPEIPFDLHEKFWTIIHALTEDPNPTPEYEARYGSENMDPLTVSLNTIRSNAFHTLFKYLYWYRQQKDQDSGLELNTEVREVLENHLNPKVDSSLAVRAVYGERLPFLVHIDSDWVRENLSKIFPMEEEQNALRKSVWETFVIYTRPWDNVFDVLKDEYKKAIESLSEESLYKSENYANRLAEHIIIFYVMGMIDIEDGGLLDKFYANAPDFLSAHVFWHIGQILKNDEIPQEVIDRIMRLVRLRIANGQTNRAEMEAFGWIFASGKFDADWSLCRLREALEISPNSNPDHSVIEVLSELSMTFPRKAIECTSLLVEEADTIWKLQYWGPHLRTAINSAIKRGEVNSVTILVNKLAARGFVEFRDLLKISKEN